MLHDTLLCKTGNYNGQYIKKYLNAFKQRVALSYCKERKEIANWADFLVQVRNFIIYPNLMLLG